MPSDSVSFGDVELTNTSIDPASSYSASFEDNELTNTSDEDLATLSNYSYLSDYSSDSEPTTFEVVIGFIILGMTYIVFPIFFYFVASWSLSRLHKHYGKVKTSPISWVPFARYYNILKNATHSKTKSLLLVLLPWITLFVGFIVTGLGFYIEFNALSLMNGFERIPYVIISGVILIFIGLLLWVIAEIWKAFLIKKYVKGDTTTALGLSTYTSLILWYVALDRSTGKTDVIGVIGFILLALFALFYITIFLVTASGLTYLLSGGL